MCFVFLFLVDFFSFIIIEMLLYFYMFLLFLRFCDSNFHNVESNNCYKAIIVCGMAIIMAVNFIMWNAISQ